MKVLKFSFGELDLDNTKRSIGIEIYQPLVDTEVVFHALYISKILEKEWFERVIKLTSLALDSIDKKCELEKMGISFNSMDDYDEYIKDSDSISMVDNSWNVARTMLDSSLDDMFLLKQYCSEWCDTTTVENVYNLVSNLRNDINIRLCGQHNSLIS